MANIEIEKGWLDRLVSLANTVTKEIDKLDKSEQITVLKTGVPFILGYISSIDSKTK